MTEFFKNNPIALRHCIRFEIIQGNSIEQAYSNICTVLGEEVIDYKKFEIRFHHFSKKKFIDKENPCAEILRNDKYALRVCILYESLKYQKEKSSVPIFEVFVNFCKVIGVEEALKFSEFEFWFYRFLKGKFDLNYEREMNEKIYKLMDMPIDVMKNVVEYLDIFDRFKLAKTSRSLRTFVEDQKLFHHTLRLYISSDTATVSFGESVCIQYIKNIAACTKVCENREIRIEGVAYWKKAIWDIRKIVKNPKLHLDTLAIELNVNQKNLFNDLEDALKFTHLLKVENLILKEYSSNLLTKVLPTLKPGYLTSINSDSRNPKGDPMNKVFEMEQWKQAKCFTMELIGFILPLHHLFHFKEFHVRLIELSVEHIRQMKEVLFKSPDFGKGSFIVFGDINVFISEQEFGNALRENPYIYHYPIPNSTEYFEIKVERHFVGHRFEVTRKKS